MLHITSLDDGLEVFKALGSDTRVEIIKILLENRQMNMNELAGRLKITNGALTSHIKKLEDCGIVTVSLEASGHGNQKICSVKEDSILVDLIAHSESEANVFSTVVKVGQYSEYDVYPTCGLSTQTNLIGEVDDPRYFAHPDRYKADILWFTHGYVEYPVPNLIPPQNRIDRITISLEIGSEAPGVNDIWPSDITFFLNDVQIGQWTSPGDFGDVRGIFTPDWWFDNWNQYGLLKLIVVNRHGTFIDGLKISDVSTDMLNLDYTSNLKLKFAVKENAEHVGGLTIYGKNFGNYRQDINIKLGYTPM
ncbi:MAG: winged helix-turn-helix transcriptional regulator [Lachnospiraceae bacterium]|nr:winged helix-turn-helix transcriptional regulator [Lachnospiraceae bacterium]